MKPLSPVIRLILTITTTMSLASCATGAPMYFHTFSFDTLTDGKVYGKSDAEVLDYAYGNSGQFGTHPSKETRELTSVFREQHTTGAMPRGDFLYVKWRIKDTGQVYEDRVDLTRRLPEDISNKEIHFLIDGPQLYIFVVPFPKLFGREIYYDPKFSEYKTKFQIYPDR